VIPAGPTAPGPGAVSAPAPSPIPVLGNDPRWLTGSPQSP
jgi:hypothetical protein